MFLKLISARRLRTILLPSLFLGFALFVYFLHSSEDPNLRYTWDSPGGGGSPGGGTLPAYPQQGVPGNRREMMNEGTEMKDRGEGGGLVMGRDGAADQHEIGAGLGLEGAARSEATASGTDEEARLAAGVGTEDAGQAAGRLPGSEESRGRGDAHQGGLGEKKPSGQPHSDRAESRRKGSNPDDPFSGPEETDPEDEGEDGSGASAKAASQAEKAPLTSTAGESAAATVQGVEKPADKSAEKSAEKPAAEAAAAAASQESKEKPHSARHAPAPAPAPQPAQPPALKPPSPPHTDATSNAASDTTDKSSAKAAPGTTTGESSAMGGPGASGSGSGELPTIIGVTATYPRATQEMYFTRLVSTLRLVPAPFVWIVVETPTKTEETASVLNRTADLCLPLGRRNCIRVSYVHLETGKADIARYNSGVASRNAALDYIEKNKIKGIVYIMDDDNTYFPQVFDEIRKVKNLGHWPVSLMRTLEWTRNKPGWPSKPVVERALVNRTAAGEWKVFGWETTFYYLPRKNNINLRKFNMDMASFAFRSSLLWEDPDPKTGYPKKPLRLTPCRMGFLENEFLKRFQESPDTIEVLSDGCTDVWVFHVHIEANQSFHYPRGWYLEQPKPAELVPLENDRGQLLVGMEKYSWPYVVNDTRHGLQGKTVPPIVLA